MTYEEYLKEEMGKESDGYRAQKSTLEKARDSALGDLDRTKNEYEAKLGRSRAKAMQNAYIQNELSKRDLPQSLSAYGVSGLTESAMMDLNRNYETARIEAQRSYDDNLRDYSSAYQTNRLNTQNQYNTQLADLQKQRETDAIAQAQYRYAQYLAAQQAAEEQRRWQLQWDAQQAALNASGGGSSGGSSGGGGGDPVTGGSTYNTQYGESDASKANSYVHQKWAEKEKARQKQINAMQSIYGKMY